MGIEIDLHTFLVYSVHESSGCVVEDYLNRANTKMKATNACSSKDLVTFACSSQEFKDSLDLLGK